MEDKLALGQAVRRLLRFFPPLSIIPKKKKAPYSAVTNVVYYDQLTALLHGLVLSLSLSLSLS